MVFGIHFAYGIDDDTFFVNDVCGTQCAFGYLAVHFFLAPGLVSLQDGQVGVGDEVERQVVFGDEVLVRFCTVAADAQHVIAQRQETLVVVAQVAGLGGAARSAVLGIKIKHQFLSGKISQLDKVAVFVLPFKIRGFRSFL